MGVPRPTLADVSAAASRAALRAATEKLRRTKAADAPARAAAALAPVVESAATRTRRLYELVSLDAADPARVLRTMLVIDRFRRELPAVLARLPVQLGHLGFKNMEELVQLFAEALWKQQTGAATLGAFRKKTKGWRWDLTGRVLFERFVKFHPELQKFFRSMASDLFAVVNEAVPVPGATAAQIAARRRGAPRLVDASGATRKSASAFDTKAMVRVEEFLVTGSDGIERSFTDFGFMAPNKEGLWAALLIEIKMPRALAKVGKQFSEFIPRLAEAKKLVARVVDEDGRVVRKELEPMDLLLMEADQGQLVVTGLSEKALLERLGGGRGTVPSGLVGSIVSLDQGASVKHGAIFYRVRLLVARSWLEPLVRIFTEPPAAQ